MWQGFCDFYHFYLTCIWDVLYVLFSRNFRGFCAHKLLKCFVHFCFAPKAEARLQQNSQQRFYMLNDPFGLLQRRSAQCWSWLMAAIFETFSRVDTALFNSRKRNPWKASYGCYLFQHPPTIASNGEKSARLCTPQQLCHADTPWKWKQILEKKTKKDCKIRLRAEFTEYERISTCISHSSASVIFRYSLSCLSLCNLSWWIPASFFGTPGILWIGIEHFRFLCMGPDTNAIDQNGNTGPFRGR